MELNQLKYFQTVARYEHMSRAAAELHIAQPSLSKAISQLEQSLGVNLFERQGRQIKLNKFGRVFKSHVDRILLEFEDGKRELSDMMGNENSRVTVASNYLPAFPKLLKGFLELYPHTAFRHIIGSTAKMKQQLENGKVDLCISSPPIEGPFIECKPLFTEEIFLIVPEGHQFAERGSINLIEAANEPFISLREGFGIRDLTEECCRQAGFTPNIVFEMDIATKVAELVNLGFGVALYPIQPWNKLPTIHPIAVHIKEPNCSRTTGLSFVQNRYLPQAARQFKDYIIAYNFY
ncbi:MAG TPA: LysR family transcriptional regulator [Firmicutes bacterium]|jgi:DNA-binding transcriptional LysR family regulator|nr:LysR family transcriptional regulator [Bacillota bacterium]